MFEVKQCSVNDVYGFFPAFDRRFRLKDSYSIYVLFDAGKAVSCLSVALEGKNYAKIHASYTPKELRRKGYFRRLLETVLDLYSDKTIKADCLPDSFGVFVDCGFEFTRKKYCNGYTLYQTIKKRDEMNGKTED